MKIAVIGGGLVGRIAAWAIMQTGHTPVIYDRMFEKIAKTPRGFVYLHEDIDLPLKPYTINIRYQGTHEGYSNKVYGANGASDVRTSWGAFASSEIGYDPGEVLSWLNGLQHEMVRDCEFTEWDDVIKLLDMDFSKIIFTLPINKFIKRDFPYIKTSIGAWPLNEGENLDNMCVYNGNPDIPWTRAGVMFGWAFREFPYVLPDRFPIIKVINGDKPPELEDILFTGRYGAWKKEALSHETYYEVIEWLQ